MTVGVNVLKCYGKKYTFEIEAFFLGSVSVFKKQTKL